MGYVMADIFSKRGDNTVKYALPCMPVAYEVKVSSGQFLIDETPVPLTYTLGLGNIGQASNPPGMTLDKFLSQFEGVNINVPSVTNWIYLLEGEDGGTIELLDSSGTIKEFKTPLIEIRGGQGRLQYVKVHFLGQYDGLEIDYMIYPITTAEHNTMRTGYTADGTKVANPTKPSGGEYAITDDGFLIGRRSIMDMLEHYIGHASGGISSDPGWIERVTTIVENATLKPASGTTVGTYTGNATRYVTNGDAINTGTGIIFRANFTQSKFDKIKSSIAYSKDEVDDGQKDDDDDDGTVDPSDGEPAGGSGKIPAGDSADIPTEPTTSFIASGLNNAYILTADELKAFTDWLYLDDIIKYLSSLFSSNPMDGILSLAVMPYTPTTAGTANITIAGKVSTAGGRVVSKQYEVFDFNYSGLTESIWGNAMDYGSGVKMELYLPFVGVVPLNTNDAIYKHLHLRFIIDNLTGSGIVVLYSSRTGSYWDSEDNVNMLGNWSFNCRNTACLSRVDVSNLINSAVSTVTSATLGSASGAIGGLINTMSQRPSVQKTGSLNASAGYLNSRVPQLIYTFSKLVIPSNQYSRVGRPTYATKKLKDCSGYVRCVNPRITFKGDPPTEEEMNEIDNLLEEGIIV